MTPPVITRFGKYYSISSRPDESPAILYIEKHHDQINPGQMDSNQTTILNHVVSLGLTQTACTLLLYFGTQSSVNAKGYDILRSAQENNMDYLVDMLQSLQDNCIPDDRILKYMIDHRHKIDFTPIIANHTFRHKSRDIGLPGIVDSTVMLWKSVDSKPVDSKPVDSKPVDSKPVDLKFTIMRDVLSYNSEKMILAIIQSIDLDPSQFTPEDAIELMNCSQSRDHLFVLALLLHTFRYSENTCTLELIQYICQNSVSVSCDYMNFNKLMIVNSDILKTSYQNNNKQFIQFIESNKPNLAPSTDMIIGWIPALDIMRLDWLIDCVYDRMDALIWSMACKRLMSCGTSTKITVGIFVKLFNPRFNLESFDFNSLECIKFICENHITLARRTVAILLKRMLRRDMDMDILLLAIRTGREMIADHIIRSKPKLIGQYILNQTKYSEHTAKCNVPDYVYLDNEERRRFAQVSHEYLIEQLYAPIKPIEPLKKYIHSPIVYSIEFDLPEISKLIRSYGKYRQKIELQEKLYGKDIITNDHYDLDISVLPLCCEHMVELINCVKPDAVYDYSHVIRSANYMESVNIPIELKRMALTYIE